ncbi:YcaO-like family protein [Desulfovibrio intestinalis]|uniref:Ribosomal protein S12 methylthiotransferase accessory factor n=1 Tax=Desulfovibrio intestinalis TaxID=58621 RepID=A0A7W8FGF1_9BACT|nr:YcaO-like family protein [Desulfovibrio intestinalis]MBB5142757.1 ribosomal protein S12 methylthiotransferase accessory factor [Desulfovibrio intestinalis]
MNSHLPCIHLVPCPKGYTRDLDKTMSPPQTIARVRQRLTEADLDILARTTRVDVNRLGIPVFLSVCGADARRVMPTRKQMGKGSSPEQAEASALMELMERYAFFSFWQERPHMVRATWSEAEARFGDALLPLKEMLRSVNEELDEAKARKVLDLISWSFYPATRLPDESIVWLPLDWFKLLGEFNGTSAGNSPEESLLQGLSELIERHVCCLADRERLVTPSIDPSSCHDPVLCQLLEAFAREGVHIVLKDFSLDMPLPTVAAIAWDPTTIGKSSEIVFTAGTAASPAKAAIRAVTEIAQLAGDFCTNACYEASGLSKFNTLEEAAWLFDGPTVSLDSLPTVENNDIKQELLTALEGLLPLTMYAVETTHPRLGIPAHYNIAPGMAFRERDLNQSLGLFVGRKLVEEADAHTALEGLEVLEECYPKAHFLPFFKGMLALRAEDWSSASALFAEAMPLQPGADAQALAAFYLGYTETLQGRWAEAIPALAKAVELCPEMKEYGNLLGVAHFKTGNYSIAADAFAAVLRVDKGSAMDLANLGLCEKFLGKNEEARQHLAAALELDPNLDFARQHLAQLEG